MVKVTIKELVKVAHALVMYAILYLPVQLHTKITMSTLLKNVHRNRPRVSLRCCNWIITA